MELYERVIFFALGGSLGFVLGYIVARLHEIKEELDDVVEIEKKFIRERRGDRGSMRLPKGKDLVLLFVILLVVLASVSSQRASNSVQDTQSRLTTIATCNMEFLSKTVSALNERTQYSQSQAEANVALQKAQADYLTVVLSNPDHIPKKREALEMYFDTLTDFVVISQRSIGEIEENPYPTHEAYTNCLSTPKE